MKIAIFHPWIKTKGGAEKLILEYALKSKNDVDIYSLEYNYKNTFKEFKNLKVFTKSTDNNHHNFIDSIKQLLLTKKFKLDDYDVLLVSTSGLSELFLLKYKKNQLPKTAFYCNTPWRSAVKDIIKYRKQRLKYLHRPPYKEILYDTFVPFYNLLEKKAWRYPQLLIFNSKLVKRRAASKRLIDHKKSKVIYPGVDLNYKVGNNAKNYLLYVARYGYEKRQHILLRAWNKIKNKNNMKLILVGGGINQDYFKNLIKLKKDGTQIKTNVPSKKLNELYEKSAAGINIPFLEDFGIVPFEVLAAGKTLITVDKGGFTELIENAPSVIWIKEKFDDEKMVNEVANGLKEFLKNKEYYIENGKKNRKFISKLNLGWDRFAREMDKALKNI